MNPIQDVCMSLSMQKVNGRVDNEPLNRLDGAVKPEVFDIPIFTLLTGVDKLVVYTRCGAVVERDWEVQGLRYAEVYIEGVIEPLRLDLMPGHMFPKFPEQLFKTDGGQLQLVEGNPFYTDLAEAYNAVLIFYIAISKMMGRSAPRDGKGRVIESVVVEPKGYNVEIIYQDDVSEEQAIAILATVNGLKAPLFDAFIADYLAGMLQENAREYESIIHEGKKALKPVFGAADWSEEDLAGGLMDVLFKPSFDIVGDGCPAYLDHHQRLMRFVYAFIEAQGVVALPLVTERKQQPIESYKDFFAIPVGAQLAHELYESIISEIGTRKLTFGDLLAIHKTRA